MNQRPLRTCRITTSLDLLFTYAFTALLGVWYKKKFCYFVHPLPSLNFSSFDQCYSYVSIEITYRTILPTSSASAFNTTSSTSWERSI